MRVFADDTGAVYRVVWNVEPGGALPYVPFPIPDGLTSLDFDDDTNTALARDLENNPTAYRLLAGVLTRNGVVVTPNPIGQFLQDKQQVQQAMGQIDTALATLDANGTLNAQQIQMALRLLLRVARYALKWMMKRG